MKRRAFLALPLGLPVLALPGPADGPATGIAQHDPGRPALVARLKINKKRRSAERLFWY